MNNFSLNIFDYTKWNYQTAIICCKTKELFWKFNRRKCFIWCQQLQLILHFGFLQHRRRIRNRDIQLWCYNDYTIAIYVRNNNMKRHLISVLQLVLHNGYTNLLKIHDILYPNYIEFEAGLFYEIKQYLV